MSLLQLRQIQKSFHGTPVLRGVDLDLASGEVHALVGANGAGKSTLIKILSGAYTRDSGEIRIDGRPVAIHNPQAGIAQGIGVIYQEFNLVPEMSVAENVLIGVEPRHRLSGVLPVVSRRRLLAEAERHLRALDFPLDPRRLVKELTTGEKQLVEIAKALYRKARILILDEPTAALSRSETSRLFEILRGLQARGIGMIYISHHLEEVFAVSDRITVLRDGRNIHTWRRDEVTEEALIRAMIGREVASGDRKLTASGEVVLAAEGLSGDGFSGVTLAVRRGEILALTGAAGAGQTELCWALAGAAPVRSGEVRLQGEAVRWKSVRHAVRRGVLMAPGDRKAYGIFPALEVQTNFTVAELRRWTAAGVLLPRQVRQATLERIRKYGVVCAGPRQEMQSLSGGNQQKIVVGRAAERDAHVYLFDEPTRGVDIGAREEVYALIRKLAERGAGIIVATPDVREALQLGDRVAVMRQGTLAYEAPAAQATEAAVVAAIIGGGNG